MEKIEKILEFLKIEPLENGDGFGSGYGSGYGSGDGFGYGSGYGFGYGDGYGYGSGDGSGYGFGSGDGYDIKIKQLNNDLVFYVDNVPTIFDHIHNNVAKGKMINIDDFSQNSCYIVKNNHFFAHGETLEEAINDLQDKTFSNLDIDEKIAEFRKIFNNKDKYSGNDFFSWHHILTGSCLAGRNNFVKSHNLDLEKTYTVNEFISLTENSYGGNIIKKLKNYYN